MDIQGKVVVITGGASGIGKAMAERFHREGAEGIVVADLNGDGAKAVAASVDGIGVGCNVANEADVIALTKTAEDRFGRIDLYCCNAGVVGRDPHDSVMNNVASAGNAAWELAWGVNVMHHVYAARAALPGMLARKSGYFLNTSSAAGLLTQVGSAVYSTTKHAAVGFAESLAITHRNDGIGVSVLCPQAVDTPLLGGARGSQNVDGVLTPEAVADAVVEGLAAESFLILPHPQVLEYMRRKTSDYDRWIRGMVRLRQSILDGSRG